MDQLNETKEVENIEQNNEHIEKQKGKCSISNKLEGPSPYEFSYVADFMGYPLDVEVSNIESLKASTIKNFSYYSDSQESNSDILDLEENKINEVENKEQEIENPKIENIQKENDKPEEKEVPNENQTNNECIKEMTSTSINTSTVKPNEIQRPTEYTAFSEYINNLTIKPPENIEVCAICEKPGAKIQCVSECKRYFHFQCLHQMVTKKEVSDRQINCENCLIRQQICAYCGHLCMISPSKFRKCSFDECQYYFHSNCEERLKESLYYKNVTSKTFICPSHFCGKCKNAILPEDEKTIECVRCYLKYHDNCWTSNDFKFITQTKMVCFRHKVKKDKFANENRLLGIFDNRPALPSYIVVYNDPPINAGNDKILKEHKLNLEKEVTDGLKVAAQEDFDIADTISVMEKQLSLAIEKSSQILQAAKGLNLSDKMDMLYKNERAGKKLSNEEIYILSQKNLTQTFDMIQDKIKFKGQQKKQKFDEIMPSNEDVHKENNIDLVQQEESELLVNKINENKEAKDVEMKQYNNDGDENNKISLKDKQEIDSVRTESISSENKSTKLSGIRKTASLISSLFGADAAKKKMKMHLEKRYKELEKFLSKTEETKADVD